MAEGLARWIARMNSPWSCLFTVSQLNSRLPSPFVPHLPAFEDLPQVSPDLRGVIRTRVGKRSARTNKPSDLKRSQHEVPERPVRGLLKNLFDCFPMIHHYTAVR